MVLLFSPANVITMVNIYKQLSICLNKDYVWAIYLLNMIEDSLVCQSTLISCSSAGADPGGRGAPGARPPKIGKNMIFWRRIVIFYTKYPNNFPASLRSAKSWIRPSSVRSVMNILRRRTHSFMYSNVNNLKILHVANLTNYGNNYYQNVKILT